MCRILIADDEDDFRKAVAEIFRAHGHEVRDCATVPAGFEILKEEAFQVVVSDLSMPGGSGLDLLLEARRRFPEAQLVLVSWWERPEEVSSLPSHFYDFVRKPVPLQDLVQRIECFAGAQPAT